MSTGGGTLGRRPDGLSATARWVVVLCWIAILIEGFDVVVIGTVMPALLDYQPCGLSPEWAGLFASLALVGMMIGSLTVGTVTDIIGRRKSIIMSVTWFSAFTALCAAAPTPELFGMFRFSPGSGSAGYFPWRPPCSRSTAEPAEEARRSRS
jgi:MFS transporter, AAHS family, benzoate transport protein